MAWREARTGHGQPRFSFISHLHLLRAHENKKIRKHQQKPPTQQHQPHFSFDEIAPPRGGLRETNERAAYRALPPFLCPIISSKFSTKRDINLDMPIRKPRISKVSINFIVFGVFLGCFPGCILSATVTLGSIVIYDTHEFIKGVKPIVYFTCQGENKTVFPDVKAKNVSYEFKGEESWQPLTEFSSKKCKRCGLYEKDTFKSDDIFDEWELCPSDFNSSDGKYVRFKSKEFNATFSCPRCLPAASPDSKSATAAHKEEKKNGWHIVLVILIVVVVLVVCIVGGVLAHKFWQKKKREQDQARFLKLFEDGDDIEEEMGLDHQGRANKSHAYTHSLEAGHHVYINLRTEKVYCLPDGYEISDLNPRFTEEQVEQIDKNKQWSRALDGSYYLPGMLRLNNMKETDFFNVTIQSLMSHSTKKLFPHP
ncbi:hypothetical protein GBA52_019426 [Prunus armeniaca]|nr:hypothetical protein GBA52_019426 [Prunus armeniaca]